MEYINELKDMFIEGHRRPSVRNIYHPSPWYKSNLLRLYKEILAEVIDFVAKKHYTGSHPLHMPSTSTVSDYVTTITRRMTTCDQFNFPLNTDLLHTEDITPDEIKFKQVWYYNEVCMIRMERFTEYSQTDVQRYIKLSRDMFYYDEAIDRFRKTFAMGVLKARIPKTNWYWDTLEKAYKPGGKIAQQLIKEYERDFMIVS